VINGLPSRRLADAKQPSESRHEFEYGYSS
jgi:hypothetical protein